MVTNVGATYGHYIIGIFSVIGGIILFIKALNKRKENKKC